MPLTLAQKSSIRRHLGYPVAGLAKTGQAGATLASGSIGYRWLQAYGFLEYKMNNLNPDEECRITGNAYGALALTGPQPAAGDTISVTISGGGLVSPVTLTAIAPAPDPASDGRITLVNLLAAAGSSNAALQAASIITLSPYGTGAYSQNSVPFPEISFSAPTAFALSASGTGASYPQVTANGVLLPPFATVSSVTGAPVIYGYLPLLDALESGYLGSSQNMDTKEAGPWKARMNEQAQRMSLYVTYRNQLADFLGTMVNPDRRAKPQRTGSVRFA